MPIIGYRTKNNSEKDHQLLLVGEIIKTQETIDFINCIVFIIDYCIY